MDVCILGKDEGLDRYQVGAPEICTLDLLLHSLRSEKCGEVRVLIYALPTVRLRGKSQKNASENTR